jgi:hypothetical protein
MSRLDLRLNRDDATACVTLTALGEGEELLDDAREALADIDGAEVREP